MEDTLRRYIERALELADERKNELDEQDLAEIARELGLTDDDLAHVEQAIADHVDRGRGYADHGMWDDAIRELEEASAIAPSRVEIRLALAQALTERWAATDFVDDKLRAEELTRGVIDRQPSNKQAYALLARLNPTSAPPPPQATTSSPQPVRKSNSAMLIVTLMGAAVAVAAGIVFFMLSTFEESHPRVTIVEKVVPREEPAAEETGEIDLPVEYVARDGLGFTALRSRLARYPEKAFYTMWGEFEVTDDAQFEDIQIAVKLLDEEGGVVKHHVEKAWGSHEATLRRGDHGVFTMLLEAPREAKSVAVNVVSAERVAASGPYAESPVVTPDFGVQVPAHLSLEVRERSKTFSPLLNGPKGFFKATWEFENTGSVPIRSLTYTVDLYDSKDRLMVSKKKIATYSSHPPIEPGDVFLESTIEMLDQQQSRYALTVIELE